MFIEVHILQNFAPANLNRDDTGSPKECEFGGHRRARISSQCLKRAIRSTFESEGLLDPEHRSSRTKRLQEALGDQLRRADRTTEEAEAVARTALESMGFGFKDDIKTQYLIFLGNMEIERLASVIDQHWDELAAISQLTPADGDSTSKRTKKEEKKDKRRNNPELGNALKAVLDGGKAADLALFGRMLADLPGQRRDAACQVAHALSTNKVNVEFDYYTAVDDRKPDDTTGADMIGVVEFSSACFYRYANIDLGTLLNNLQQDIELARETTRAFLKASVIAVPTGKQNSMAAQNPPSFVMVVVRDRGLWSLANAFVHPVSPEPDLVSNSVRQLDNYWRGLNDMYGNKQIQGVWVACLDGALLVNLKDHQVGAVDTLIERAVAAAFPAAAGQ